MRFIGMLVLFGCLGLPNESPAQQAGSIELGLDAGLIAKSPEKGSGSVEVLLPIDRFRFGIFASRLFQVEPSLSFALLDFHSERSTTTYHRFQLGLDLVLHTSPPAESFTPFFKAGILVNTSGVNEVNSQFGVGGGLGLKARFSDAWAFRTDLSLAKFFETDDLLGSWDPRLGLGVSRFFRL